MSQIWICNEIIQYIHQVSTGVCIKNYKYQTKSSTIVIKASAGKYNVKIAIHITFDELKDLNQCIYTFAKNGWHVFPLCDYQFIHEKIVFDNVQEDSIKYISFEDGKYVLSAAFNIMNISRDIDAITELVTIFIQYSTKMLTTKEILKIRNYLHEFNLVDDITDIICDYLIGGV